MNNANFIAFDFETAFSHKNPCQIGIAVVKNGVIVDRISKLIQPPDNKYFSKCIGIHGITPDKTMNEPLFPEVWTNIKKYFEGNFIIAHNKSFDLSVLDSILDYYNIEHPIFMGTHCTYEITGAKLNQACKKYDIELTHHDALSDAVACAKLFLLYLSGGMDKKEVPQSACKENQHLSIKDTTIHLSDTSLDLSLFKDKGVIITGETSFDRDAAYKIIESFGGIKKSSITKNVNIVIIGDNPGQIKLNKAYELQNSGHDITVISAHDFLSLLKKHED